MEKTKAKKTTLRLRKGIPLSIDCLLLDFSFTALKSGCGLQLYTLLRLSAGPLSMPPAWNWLQGK